MGNTGALASGSGIIGSGITGARMARHGSAEEKVTGPKGTKCCMRTTHAAAWPAPAANESRSRVSEAYKTMGVVERHRNVQGTEFANMWGTPGRGGV